MLKLTTLAAAILFSLSALAGQVQVDIKGMSCVSCVGKITESLTKTGKCSNVKVDLDAKKATFETKGDITDAEIKKVIEDTGYAATKITRS
ncbi:MAG: heavy-metal-associated domain-containing protein [Bacteriovoracia bacterium]